MKIKIILIVVLATMFGCISMLKAQTKSITMGGMVMSESGEELIGVSVIVKNNSGLGTVTDMDGHFKMTGLQKGQVLVFSYIGYVVQEYNRIYP